MTIPVEGIVLGIDIGYSEQKKTTGICMLKWNTQTVSLKFDRWETDASLRKERLLTKIENQRLTMVAIDGPLCGSLDEIGVYRDAEMMLTRGFQDIGKPGQASSGNGRKLNQSANIWARMLIDSKLLIQTDHLAKIHDKGLVEAFPTTFLGVMIDQDMVPSAGARSDVYFEHLLGPDSPRPPLPSENRLVGLLNAMLPGREIGNDLAAVTHHEDRAAVVCAMTALCVAIRQYVAVGDARNGYIILPPKTEIGKPGLQPWAWQLLQTNRRVCDTSQIITEGDLVR